jgi:hypothetical protein
MGRFLVNPDDMKAWDGNVPADAGTYFIVEVIETLRVGQPKVKAANPQQQRQPAQPAQAANSRKKNIEVSDEDLEDIEIPLPKKEAPVAAKPPKRGTEVRGADVYLFICGKSLKRPFGTEAKAKTAKAAMDNVLEDASRTDKETLDQLVNSGKWEIA